MAEEAANAALIAAEGAKQAKELVKAMEVNGVEKKKNVGEVMLENSKIGELTVLNVSKMWGVRKEVKRRERCECSVVSACHACNERSEEMTVGKSRCSLTLYRV